MRYLLDTNTCIEHFRKGAVSPVTNRILAVPQADIALCSVVRGELLVGALKSQDPTASIAQVARFAANFPSLPFDDLAADRYAELRAHLETTGMPIGPNDMLIAGIAMAHGLIIVTNNLKEYQRVPGLAVEDWMRP